LQGCSRKRLASTMSGIEVEDSLTVLDAVVVGKIEGGVETAVGAPVGMPVGGPVGAGAPEAAGIAGGTVGWAPEAGSV